MTTPLGMGPSPGEGLPITHSASLGTDRVALVQSAIALVQITLMQGRLPEDEEPISRAFEAALKLLETEFKLGPQAQRVEHAGGQVTVTTTPQPTH